jgi:AraC-like DNA-binding protein
VIASVTDPRAVIRLNAAFPHALVLVRDPSGITTALMGLTRSALIIEPTAEVQSTLAASISTARLSGHIFVCCVYFNPLVHQARQLLALGRAGASELIVFGQDDDPTSLRSLVAMHGPLRSTRQAVMAEPDLAPQMRSIAEYCFAHAGRQLRAAAIAEHHGVTPRTLTHWSRRAGFRGLEEFVSRCRIVLALGSAQATGETLEATAFRFGFGSAAHLSGMVRRHTSMGWRGALMIDAAWWSRRLLGRAGSDSAGPCHQRKSDTPPV